MSDLSLGLLVAAVLVCGVVAIAVYLMRKVDSLITRAANWITRVWQSWQIRRDERKRRRTESLVSRHVDLATMALQCVGDRDREIAELKAQLAAAQPRYQSAPQPASPPTPQPPQTLAVQDIMHAINLRLGAMDDRLRKIELERMLDPPRRRNGMNAALPPKPQQP